MKYFVRAVTTAPLAAGFRLSGMMVDDLDGREDSATIGRRLVAAADRAQTGILLIEQSLFDAAPEDTRRDLEKRSLPIIVPVPAAAFAPSAHAAEDYILDLLRRAIGYRVRLQ
jgi:vacuolar-type H+-ATPase subunit F/Vma7